MCDDQDGIGRGRKTETEVQRLQTETMRRSVPETGVHRYSDHRDSLVADTTVNNRVRRTISRSVMTMTLSEDDLAPRGPRVERHKEQIRACISPRRRLNLAADWPRT